MTTQHYINEPLTPAEMECWKAVKKVIKQNPGLKITQQMVATQLNKTQPTVCKQLGCLKDKGYVRYTRKRNRSLELIVR